MRIIINGKDAVLKKGTSFEFVAENRLFSDADGYSLSISFPLKNCIENIDIFGFAHRFDFDISNTLFDCEIIAKSFYRAGVLSVTEISETEIKTQFLDGRSAQNFKNSFDEIYINSLDLGAPSSTDPAVFTPEESWKSIDDGCNYVALPWVNYHSGNVQNDVVYNNGIYTWSEKTKGLSWQPYLIFITKKIFDAVGYTSDLKDWETHNSYMYLLICNSIPFAWEMSDFAAILPKWSLTEFIKELELFMGAEFDIDHKQKHIVFSFSNAIQNVLPTEKIDMVIDSFCAEVDSEMVLDYVPTSNFKYKDGGHNMSKYYSADWFLDYYKDKLIKYKTIDELLEATSFFKFYLAEYQMVNDTWGPTQEAISKFHLFNSLLYAEDIDTYFIIYAYKSGSADARPWVGCYLIPINVYSPLINNQEENANEIELNMIPVCIDETDMDAFGLCMVLDAGTLDMSYDLSAYLQSNSYPAQIIKTGEKSNPESFYDSLFVGFWNGVNIQPGRYPIPFIDDVFISSDWTKSYRSGFSLRLKNIGAATLNNNYKINHTQKFQFSFISDSIPNVRSVFFINGKKYLCEKITATFTENGMSELKKGVFYRIID
ncbi:MAG: hypothetical protein E7081_02615 [Bacteroidales bacterium]|nr:hypothetical protein [Bacteroidales bacterium]